MFPTETGLGDHFISGILNLPEHHPLYLDKIEEVEVEKKKRREKKTGQKEKVKIRLHITRAGNIEMD